MEAVFNGVPTYNKPAANNSESQLDTPLIKIAADTYRAHINSADIKQKTEPTPLLFIVLTSLSNCKLRSGEASILSKRGDVKGVRVGAVALSE